MHTAFIRSRAPMFFVTTSLFLSVADRASAESASSNTCVETQELCGPVAPGHRRCMAKRVVSNASSARGILPFSAAPKGLGPDDLRSAYNLPASGGSGRTVAIVDAYDAPNAEADMNTYRAQYGLPACTTANGCFKKVNQTGQPSPLPKQDQGWAGEIALDLDMVSAVCPDCKILLVESDETSSESLGAAVNTAAALGAAAISNSYGGDEDDTVPNDTAYNHPGILVTAASGDHAYAAGPQYPASSPHVLAVGGTSLTKTTSGRGWSETVWYSMFDGSGSGCSKYVEKPAYQKDSGCAKRTVADVSAVADPATGVATYDGGWQVIGGTSAASPIVAAAFTLLGLNKVDPSFPYAHPDAFYDVTTGNNGFCQNEVCTAGVGYDGPTGLGTPNGASLAPLRTCTAADNGDFCNGATPVCEVDVKNANVGKCVACTASKDCKTKTAPACDRTTDTCRGCRRDSECGAATPRCVTATGQCVACVTSADCSSAAPVCDTVTNSCRGCGTDSECAAPNVCDLATKTCTAPLKTGSGDAGADSGAPGGSNAGAANADGASDGSGSDAGNGCTMAPRDDTTSGLLATTLLAGFVTLARRRRRTFGA
jgi:hypothetical protein